MEILVISVWFYAIVMAGTAFAAYLIVRAMRADNRYLAEEAPHAEQDPGSIGRLGAGSPSTALREAAGSREPIAVGARPSAAAP
jgi:hypothetical protein